MKVTVKKVSCPICNSKDVKIGSNGDWSCRAHKFVPISLIQKTKVFTCPTRGTTLDGKLVVVQRPWREEDGM